MTHSEHIAMELLEIARTDPIVNKVINYEFDRAYRREPGTHKICERTIAPIKDQVMLTTIKAYKELNDAISKENERLHLYQPVQILIEQPIKE